MSLASVIGALRVNLSLDSAQFTNGVNQAGASSGKLNKMMGVAAGATVALGGALAAMSGKAITSAVELKNMAQVANAGFEEFQGFAAGAKTVGMEADALSDVLKDVNDKIGDYFATGAGAMVDFFDFVAPKIGLTADAFRDLSGPEALQLYVDSLEKAGLSQQDMTFYLEALGSDLTKLLPLLRNGGAEMSRFADAANEGGAVMSEETADTLIRAKRSIDDITTGFAGMSQSIIGQVAPSIEKAAASMADFIKNSVGLRAIADVIGGTLSVAITGVTAILTNLGTAVSAVAIVAAGRFVSAMTAAVMSLNGMSIASLRFIAGMTAGAVAMKAKAAAAGLLRGALAAVGGPVGLVVAGLGLMAMGFMRARQRAEEQRQTITNLKDAYVAYEAARKTADAAPSVETIEAKKVAAQEKLNLLLEREGQIRREQTQMGLQAQFGAIDNDRANSLAAELTTVRDDIIATNYQVQLLGQTLSGPVVAGARVLTNEMLAQITTLKQATAQKEVQIGLDRIAATHGADSLVYKEAQAAATRDAEIATLNALAAQVEGNAEASAAVDHAIAVANATYDAEVAGHAFAAAMASVNAQVQAIAASMASLSGVHIGLASAKLENRILKETGDAAAAGVASERYRTDAEYSARKKELQTEYGGNWSDPTYQQRASMLDEEYRAVIETQNVVLENQSLIEAARAKESGGGGGGKSAGSAGGAAKPSDAEREAERVADSQADALRKLTDEHALYQQTLGMSEQSERIFRAQQETGALGDEAKVAQVRQLIVETDALKRANDGLRNVVNAVDSTFGDMFTSVITKASSASDALKNMGNQLAKMAAQGGWDMLWKGNGGWGGLGGMVSGWLGGATPSPIGQNANGTNNWSGGLTWVGERGPELLDLSRGSKIISNPASKRLIDGSANGGRYGVDINLGAGLVGEIVGQANDNAVKITQAGIASYDTKQASQTWNKTRQDPRAKG